MGRVVDQAQGRRSERPSQEAWTKVEEQEDMHLYHTMGWTRELWIEAIFLFWHLRGYLREGRRICRMLGMPAVLPPPEDAHGPCTRSPSVHYWSSYVEAARREYEQALASAREAGAIEVEAEALYALGYVLAFAKEWDQAYEGFEASGALYERIGDRLGLTLARYSKAFTYSLAGHWGRRRSRARGGAARVRRARGGLLALYIATRSRRTLRGEEGDHRDRRRSRGAAAERHALRTHGC